MLTDDKKSVCCVLDIKHEYIINHSGSQLRVNLPKPPALGFSRTNLHFNMALVTTFVCKHCETPKFELVLHDGLCSDCRSSIESNRRRMFLENRQRYSDSQRLDMLEEMFYDLNAEQRLKALEAINARY